MLHSQIDVKKNSNGTFDRWYGVCNYSVANFKGPGGMSGANRAKARPFKWWAWRDAKKLQKEMEERYFGDLEVIGNFASVAH